MSPSTRHERIERRRSPELDGDHPMRTRHLSITLVGLLAVVGCGNFRDRSVLSSGTWALEKMEVGGGAMKDAEAFEIAFSPHGNSVVITVGSKIHKGVYELQ